MAENLSEGASPSEIKTLTKHVVSLIAFFFGRGFDSRRLHQIGIKGNVLSVGDGLNRARRLHQHIDPLTDRLKVFIHFSRTKKDNTVRI